MRNGNTWEWQKPFNFPTSISAQNAKKNWSGLNNRMTGKIESVSDCTNKYKNLVQSAYLTYDRGSGKIYLSIRQGGNKTW